MTKRCPNTPDLLDWAPPPGRAIVPVFSTEVTRAGSLYARLILGMNAAIDESGKDRPVIVRDMAEFLGQAVTEHGLNAALSQARTDHVINVLRYTAIAHATQDPRLISLLADPLDHVVVHRRYLPWIEVGMWSEAGDEADRRRKQALRAARAGGRP